MYKVWRNMQRIFVGLFNKVTYRGVYITPARPYRNAF